jgi:pyruvate dehydrogenase E1 component alpha subunit
MARDPKEPPKEVLLRLYRMMVTIRRFEEEVKRLYRGGEIVGAIHLYIGQEAVAAGTCEALRDDDYITSGHRSHGHTLAKRLDIGRTMAEMMGRVDGHSKGRGGSMHMFDVTKGHLGGNGIVGGGIAIATGAAFSARYRGTDQVALCFFSEGASNQGILYECLNMASLWKLPVIYLCENNRYAATTPVERSTCTRDIAPRAKAFGLPCAICDGNDVLDVYNTVSKAVARARRGGGGTFVEAKTYRVEPHCGIISDARDKDELQLWRDRKHDPIARAESAMRKRSFRKKTFDAVRDEVERDLAEAVEFARRSPFPEPSTVGDYV